MNLERDNRNDRTFHETSYFQGAHDLVLTNVSITNLHGNQYTNIVNNASQLSGKVAPYETLHFGGLTSLFEYLGFAALHQQISDNAMFDSAVRYPAGRCHPGTREKVIEAIIAWINEPSHREPVLWLYGPAGVGKSAIMQTIAELLSERYQERYAGSFFFSNGVVGRTEASSLFPTLSYQIAVNFPGTRPFIDNAMTRDLALPTKSIPVQLRHLILDPLISSGQSLSRPPPTVIIDGLDECQGPEVQCQILKSISDTMNSLKEIPLRFLVASRPEHWLKNYFEHEPLCTMTRRMSLHVVDHEAFQSVQSDIEQFLIDGFESIISNHRGIMASVKRPWPSPDTIKSLVSQASGQFIYASTILKFVGNSSNFCDPVTQLRMITEGDYTSRSSAFSDLDTLYLKVLSAYPRPESLKSVLAGLLLRMPSLSIQHLLDVDPRELLIVLDFLRSVLDMGDGGTSLNQGLTWDDKDLQTAYSHRKTPKVYSFSHLSFREFLEDRQRSDNFYISLTRYREEIATRFFQSISDSLAGLPGSSEHRGFIYRSIDSVLQHESIFDPFCVLLEELHKQLVVATTRGPLLLPRPATLLRSLHSIEVYLLALRSVKVHRKIFDAFLDNLRKTVYPRIVHHMLSSSSLQLSDNLLFMLGEHITLKSLAEMPGNTLERALSFLVENEGIIATSKNRIAVVVPGLSTRSYSVLDVFRDVLEGDALAKLGTFRTEYRRLNMQVAHRFLLYLSRNPNQDEIWDIVIEILLRFFKNPRLSDILEDSDMTNDFFLPAINILLENSWTKSDRIVDSQWHTLTMCLINWSIRQNSQPLCMEIMRRCNMGVYLKIRSFPAKMFEDILPSYLVGILPYLSEILVHSPGHDCWKLPECNHSPPHRSSTPTGKWDITVNLTEPARERRIADLLLKLPGNAAPLYVICLSRRFVELYSDHRSSGRPWLPSASTESASASLFVCAVEEILAALHVARYLAIADS